MAAGEEICGRMKVAKGTVCALQNLGGAVCLKQLLPSSQRGGTGETFRKIAVRFPKVPLWGPLLFCGDLLSGLLVHKLPCQVVAAPAEGLPYDFPSLLRTVRERRSKENTTQERTCLSPIFAPSEFPGRTAFNSPQLRWDQQPWAGGPGSLGGARFNP